MLSSVDEGGTAFYLSLHVARYLISVFREASITSYKGDEDCHVRYGTWGWRVQKETKLAREGASLLREEGQLLVAVWWRHENDAKRADT